MRQLEDSERELLARIVADGPVRVGAAERRCATRLEHMGLVRTIASRAPGKRRFAVASGAGIRLAERACSIDAFAAPAARSGTPAPAALVA